MLALRMRDGPLAGERYEVEGEVVRAVDSALEIEDLGSLNGTVVNSEKVESPRRLEPGDVIMVGATTLEVVGDPLAGSRTVLAGTPPVPLPTAPPAEPVEVMAPSVEQLPEAEPSQVEPQPEPEPEPEREPEPEPEPAPVEPEPQPERVPPAAQEPAPEPPPVARPPAP